MADDRGPGGRSGAAGQELLAAGEATTELKRRTSPGSGRGGGCATQRLPRRAERDPPRRPTGAGGASGCCGNGKSGTQGISGSNHTLAWVLIHQSAWRSDDSERLNAEAACYFTAVIALRSDSPALYVDLHFALSGAKDIEGAFRAVAGRDQDRPQLRHCPQLAGWRLAPVETRRAGGHPRTPNRHQDSA